MTCCSTPLLYHEYRGGARCLACSREVDAEGTALAPVAAPSTKEMQRHQVSGPSAQRWPRTGTARTMEGASDRNTLGPDDPYGPHDLR